MLLSVNMRFMHCNLGGCFVAARRHGDEWPIVRDGVTSSTLLHAHVTARSNMGTLQKTRL